MSLIVNIYYTGKDGNAKAFVKEMFESGTVEKIRSEAGNLRYEYFFTPENPETVLLIDEWLDEKALDWHHKSEMMQTVAALREKYCLKMRVERLQKENQK